jgi:hypothetical protein
LHNAENRRFQIPRQRVKIVRRFQINLHLAAHCKSFHIPPESGSESSFVQQGWMKQIRNRAEVCSHVFDQGFAIRDGSSRFCEALKPKFFDWNYARFAKPSGTPAEPTTQGGNVLQTTGQSLNRVVIDFSPPR